MKVVVVLLGVFLSGVVVAGCGVGPGRGHIEPWESDHPWFQDDSIEVPGENLADSRVFSAVRNLARASGIDTRDIIIEFRGTTRSVPDGPMAGFRALTFTASVAGEPAAVQSFVDRLDQGEPYPTLVVYEKTFDSNAVTTASLRFNVYTLPAR